MDLMLKARIGRIVALKMKMIRAGKMATPLVLASQWRCEEPAKVTSFRSVRAIAAC